MNRIFLLIIATFVSSVAWAVNLDPATRIRLDSRGLLTHKVQSRADSSQQLPPYRPLILKIDQQATIDSLRALDVIIYNQRDDLLLTSVPRDSLMRVLALQGVIDAAASGDMSACLDYARPFNKVDAVQQAIDLPQAYDGDGVVVGFSDIGFDPNHIAFTGRIARVYNYNTEEGIRQSATTPEEIAAWTTDDINNYHATHVANIMAGGFKGNPYYGVATGAEIVGTTSRLYDVGILSGVEDIISYAKHVGKRPVVNLSLSNFLGPHDGTSLMCQYLSRCAEDAVICISAGNSGNTNGFATQQLALGEGAVDICDFKTWVNYDVAGYTDIWSESAAPFEFCIQVYDCDNKEIVYSTPWVSDECYILVTDAEDEEWAKYMSGLVYAECGWSRLNDKYNVAVMYDTHTVEQSGNGKWARYQTCLRTRRPSSSTSDLRVNYYADATHTFFGRIANNSTLIGSQGSISDLCTAPGVISVGMACSRNSVPILNGEPMQWNIPVDQVTKYSSYSDTPGIKPLPIITAAGSYLVSAANSYYVEAHPDAELSAMSEVDGENYYWLAQGGTSMSSPLVAGIIAIWLQIDPSLTVDQIVDIMCSTALRDYEDISNPRWGAGNIDAYAGTKEVMRRAGIVDAVDAKMFFISDDRRLQLSGYDYDDVRLYNVYGTRINPTSALCPGIYIIELANAQPQKIVVK